MKTLRALLVALIAQSAWASTAYADEDAAREAAQIEAAAGQQGAPSTSRLDKGIRPVSGKRLVRGGRHELSPWVGMSLGDAFFDKYMAGLRYAWHPGEAWSIGIGAAVAHSEATGALQRCAPGAVNCAPPTKGDLRRTPGDLNYLVGVDLAWAPLYGKVSVLAEKVLHFDTYLLAGGGMVQTRIEPPGEQELKDEWSPEAHLAIGQRYYLGPNATLRLELRETLYQQTVLGRSGPESKLQSLLLFSVGLSFFLGGA